MAGIGKKIATPSAKGQKMPASAKLANAKMGAMMAKPARTTKMKGQSNKGSKKY